MKFNTPIPQSLPKECIKAAKIFDSFVDGGNNGLDGVIPRHILENAKGFAIFTVFKAGFLFSARAGSGVVVARLEDGTWSAPSAIGTAGLGVGGQAGAEMTDFLVVLNSRSAVKSFMAAGSLTLGGNLSIAVGPLGRNGEVQGSLNSSGQLAAMYSYSKTRGLFGGVSIEGSVIAERQDANAQAYNSDVSAKMLLSGAVPSPEWAQPLIQTLEACTGMPGNRKWVHEHNARNPDEGYIFGGVESSQFDSSGSKSKKKDGKSKFLHKSGDVSSFDFKPQDRSNSASPRLSDDWASSRKSSRNGVRDSLEEPWQRGELNADDRPTTEFFQTKFESDFVSDEEMRKHPPLKPSPKLNTQKLVDDSEYHPGSPFNSLPPFNYARSTLSNSDASSHRRSISTYTPVTNLPTHSFSSPASATYARKPFKNPFSPSPPPSTLVSSSSSSGGYGGLNNKRVSVDYLEDLDGRGPAPLRSSTIPKIKPKIELTRPLSKDEGVARAIALYDFKAVQPGDLSFSKGDVITVKEMSGSTDTWWKGKMAGREGIFPANFVEVV